MIQLQEAVNIVYDNISLMEKINVPLKECYGYILASDVKAGRDVPPFNKSAMDGFVVLKDDSSDKFKITGTISAGTTISSQLRKGQCCRIMTGAPVVWDNVKVIKIENTRVDGEYMIPEKQDKKDHICMKGEDIRSGETVIKAPVIIDSAIMGVLATAGIGMINVYKRPVVSIIVSGDELTEPGTKPKFAQIFNANSYSLIGSVLKINCIPEYNGIVRDDKHLINDAINKAVQTSDMVIITGGASVGDFDYTYETLENLNCKLCFNKVAIKPGKPTLFAKKDKTIIFGLPGNPVSGFIVFEFIVKKALYYMQGFKFEHKKIKAVAKEDLKIKNPDGRLAIIPVSLAYSDDEVYASPVNMNGPADIIALQYADGFVHIESTNPVIKKGTKTNIFPA